MIRDMDAYFRKAWKKHWNGTDESQLSFSKEFGIDFWKYAKKYDIQIGGYHLIQTRTCTKKGSRFSQNSLLQSLKLES